MYLQKSKDEVFNKFIEFQTRVEKQIGCPVKKLRNDRDGEYRLKEDEGYLKEHGIITEMNAPYSSQSNGIIEKKNHTSIEMIVNSMLIIFGLPTCY